MRSVEWAVIALLILASNALTLYMAKHYLVPEIKTVSLIKIVDDPNSPAFEKFKKGEIDEQGFLAQTEKRIAAAKSMMQQEKGIVLVKESVVEGGIDITEKVKAAITNVQ